MQVGFRPRLRGRPSFVDLLVRSREALEQDEEHQRQHSGQSQHSQAVAVAGAASSSPAPLALSETGAAPVRRPVTNNEEVLAAAAYPLPTSPASTTTETGELPPVASSFFPEPFPTSSPPPSASASPAEFEDLVSESDPHPEPPIAPPKKMAPVRKLPLQFPLQPKKPPSSGLVYPAWHRIREN